jgi:hypothetical protein
MVYTKNHIRKLVCAINVLVSREDEVNYRIGRNTGKVYIKIRRNIKTHETKKFTKPEAFHYLTGYLDAVKKIGRRQFRT